MNRLRVMLIAAALMTGGSALASAQAYDHGGKDYKSDRDRNGDRDRYFKRSYDRDDRGRHFDNDRGNRDRYDRDRRKSDRDDYRKYERRDGDRYH